MQIAPPRSLSLSGLPLRSGTPWGDSPKGAIAWAAHTGYRAVQLDAATPGIRARELDRSARRDLASLLRRLELSFSGLDLWIPPAHFADPANVDRAVQAVSQAAELATELASLLGARGATISITLPKEPAPGAIAGLNAACERSGAAIADHTWPVREPVGAIGLGIDPAAILMGGGNPAGEVSRLTAPPLAARLSDVSAAGRVALGAGRLDVLAYEVALSTRGYHGFAIVDLRAVSDPLAAAQAGLPPGNRQTPRK